MGKDTHRMRILPSGAWDNDTEEGHGVDEGLANGIAKFILQQRGKIVIDIGCGNGFYTRVMNSHNGISCAGFDGNPNTPEITHGVCRVADFSKPQYLGLYDWVLSLEVGEHIPEEFEDIFLDNLCRHALTGIILSWAIPGQGGDGHVNCRDNKYIEDKLNERGFELDAECTNSLRQNSNTYPKPCYWFRDTLLVFRRRKDENIHRGNI